jgi:hypothetical protein
MSHCDFHYSHLLPKKPGILPLEETMTKQCRRCGAQFVTKSRIRKRCDTCQTLVSAEKQKKANERLKLRRAVCAWPTNSLQNQTLVPGRLPGGAVIIRFSPPRAGG